MKHLCVTLLTVVALMGGCSGDNGDPSEQTPPVQLTLGHVGHDHQIALYIAALESERFKKDYGIFLKMVKDREVYDLIEDDKPIVRLRLIKVGGGSKMTETMARGEIQIGLGGVVAVAKFADKGAAFKIIAPLQTDGDMLVMKTGSPITDWASFVAAAKAADAPIRIGFKAPVAVAKLILEKALQAEGIQYGPDATAGAKIILVNMRGGKNSLPLLSQGAIDGFVMNQPSVAIAEAKGVGKVVADLRDLPPAGHWHEHPCCCVAATEQTLREHGERVKSLLKLLRLATELIRKEPDLAVRRAHEWTKVPLDVEKASVPTITYTAAPTEQWRKGMIRWAAVMGDIKAFSGKYADMTPEQIVADVCDLSLAEAAEKELRERKLIE